MTRAIVFAVGCLMLWPAGADAQEITSLDALLSRFASAPGFSATFREEKRIALLAAPLVNEGTLYYARPDKLARHTRRPEPSALLIDGDRLSMRGPTGTRRVSVNDSPAVRAFVDSFRGLLAGDRAALERSYRVSFETDDDGWRVTLRPRHRELARLVRSIVVSGRGDRMQRLVVTEASGDVSDTRFSDVQPRRRFSEPELRRLFR